MGPERGFPLGEEVNGMSERLKRTDDGISQAKKEERALLTTAIVLAPLFSLIIQILEIILKLLGLIN